MICVLEIILFILGIVCMVRGRIDLGRNVVGKPMVYLIGLLLMGCLGVPLAAGFALGFMEAAKGGDVDVAKVSAEYWWVELVCLGVCGVLALILTLVSQRPKTDDEYYTGGRRRRRRDEEGDDEDYDRPRRRYDRDDDVDDRDRDDRGRSDEDDRPRRRRYDDDRE